MYASALPAGDFRGVGSMYVSREGATVSARARRNALARVGIRGLSGGLGDPNLCTDPGWIAARSIIDASGRIISAAAGTGDTADRGWATVGTGVDAVGDVWASACAATARGDATATAQPTESVADVIARARAEMERDSATARASELSLQTQQQQAAAAAAAASQRNMMIGGGVLLVALVGGFFLLRK